MGEGGGGGGVGLIPKLDEKLVIFTLLSNVLYNFAEYNEIARCFSFALKLLNITQKPFRTVQL